MARANALLIIPGDEPNIREGETFMALPLDDSLNVVASLVLN